MGLTSTARMTSYLGPQGVIQSQPVPKATSVDYLESRHSVWPLVHVQEPRRADPVFETLKGNVEKVAPRIIGDAP